MLQNYICIKREVTDKTIGLFVQDDLDDIPERFPCKSASRKITMFGYPCEFGTYRICEQQMHRLACANAQSRPRLHCSHTKKLGHI